MDIYIHTKDIFVDFNNYLLKIERGKDESVAIKFHHGAYKNWLKEFSNHDFLRHSQEIQEYNRFGFKHSQGFVTYYSRCRSINELNTFLKSIFGIFKIHSIENLLKIRWLIQKILPVIMNNRYQQLCTEEINYNRLYLPPKIKKTEYSVFSDREDLILIMSSE